MFKVPDINDNIQIPKGTPVSEFVPTLAVPASVSYTHLILMQNSRVRGLPQISTEDLKSRLTDDEIESIKRWAKSRKIEYVSIVKKIPFAIFLELGFVGYFIIWSLLI